MSDPRRPIFIAAGNMAVADSALAKLGGKRAGPGRWQVPYVGEVNYAQSTASLYGCGRVVLYLARGWSKQPRYRELLEEARASASEVRHLPAGGKP
jgi:hypothetical protein